MKRIGGFRRKTRSKLRKNVRNKGKFSIRRYFQSFNKGDRVYLVAEPAIQGGMYLPRFHGKSGKIKGMQGNCYFVEIKDKNKVKKLLVHPVHLKKSWKWK